MLWARSIAAIMAIAMLAGCADDQDGDAETDDPTADDGQDPGDHDGDPGDDGSDPSGEPTDDNATENRAPTIAFDAEGGTGSDALNVAFAINGTDPDGDALTWWLDADGDGEKDAEGDSLPANASHEYSAEGNHSATAWVSDGVHTVNASLTVRVSAGAAEVVTEIWNLAWPSDADGDCMDRFMSQTAASDFACTFTAQTVAVAAGPLTWDFLADAPSNGFPAGTSLQADLRPFFLGPYAGSMDFHLEADGVTVASGSKDIGPAAGAETIDIDADATLDQPVPPGAVLTFVFTMDTAGYMEMSSGQVTIG